MRAPTVLLIVALGLAGCDRITGAADQKISDAEAIGFACRVSLKTPEDCMKENESHSPTSILNGWKAADKAIKERTIDPAMGRRPVVQPGAPVAAAQSAVKPTEPETAARATKPDAAPSGSKAAH